MIYLITVGFFLLMIILMSLGVMARRKPIQGSCGGLSNVGVDKVCNCETTCAEHQTTLYQIQEPQEKSQQK
ncbi:MULTISPECIES: (Na+)-NQR maturation NqrM [Vibrio]|uniref:(Na+)-NQR maturation NqrM n=1 Tax=Vibrio TaxID=662 RepID=UPI000C16CF4F|nr:MULTISPECIES: (Na+)-NQR maturation NqrM [Vibrio]NAW69691.1 (Na+)-NQR maturation NqrM [Vibrio sp. V28_P6S34P95]NAX03664.1 (Na+)-NQR maturation NqrM [Vibrio sp. V30_P3S12P165]NAX35029.1 (Na+)-NQR maturation NqrM [Vibrio sp. V29_P1S30P107]NAX36353.1 (Na+)-NQR maturation NqrM [Vibrio sp. V27_P1S3P104]NAX40570.1 (Na+)-NQR maturation NqrM [Vibrio sp. V26_P1S5P106]